MSGAHRPYGRRRAAQQVRQLSLRTWGGAHGRVAARAARPISPNQTSFAIAWRRRGRFSIEPPFAPKLGPNQGRCRSADADSNCRPSCHSHPRLLVRHECDQRFEVRRRAREALSAWGHAIETRQYIMDQLRVAFFQSRNPRRPIAAEGCVCLRIGVTGAAGMIVECGQALIGGAQGCGPLGRPRLLRGRWCRLALASAQHATENDAGDEPAARSC